jgi:hypothetical protein
VPIVEEIQKLIFWGPKFSAKYFPSILFLGTKLAEQQNVEQQNSKQQNVEQQNAEQQNAGQQNAKQQNVDFQTKNQ